MDIRRVAAALVFSCLLAARAGAESAPPVLLHADHPLVGQLWDMRSHRRIDAAELRQRLGSAQALLLGETHDNPEHHRLQRQLFQDYIDAGKAPVLVMEQFDVERQAAMNAALATPPAAGAPASADTLADAGQIAKSWDWPLYRPLVATALDRRLPILAANLPRERIRPVIRGGFSAFDSAELRRLRVEDDWSEARQHYLADIIARSHCGQVVAPELRDGLVRAQRLRDATMADVMLPHLGRGVVAVIGRGHARRDVGVPRHLEFRQPGARTLAIGFVEVSPDKTSAEDYESERADATAPFDVLWFTARVDRPDPCAGFGKIP